MSEKEMVIVLSIVFMFTQIVYFMISKSSTDKLLKYNQKSMDKILTSIQGVLESIKPHLDKASHMHEQMDELKKLHDVRGPDGNLMIYAPTEITHNCKEILSTSYKISRVCQETSGTLKDISIMIRDMAGKLDTHQDLCKEQYYRVDRRITNVTSRCAERGAPRKTEEITS